MEFWDRREAKGVSENRSATWYFFNHECNNDNSIVLSGIFCNSSTFRLSWLVGLKAIHNENQLDSTPTR